MRRRRTSRLWRARDERGPADGRRCAPDGQVARPRRRGNPLQDGEAAIEDDDVEDRPLQTPGRERRRHRHVHRPLDAVLLSGTRARRRQRAAPGKRQRHALRDVAFASRRGPARRQEAGAQSIQTGWDLTITRQETEQVERANASRKTPVVFIHGLWLLPSSWERWSAFFEKAGYIATTPGWPDDPPTVAEARVHPELLAGKSVGQVAAHMAEFIGLLKKK